MAELTELPEKWCIKITEENKDILTKWKRQNHSRKEKAGEYGSIYISYNGFNCIGKNDKTEITFEQFKKWVLKEETKSLVGRYLKALVDEPNGGVVKKSEIGIIIDVQFDVIPQYVNFPSQKRYYISIDTYNDGKSYELMPEGFKPEDLITTKFEVGKWYKGKYGYYLKPIKIKGDYSLQGADYITDNGKYVFNGSGEDDLNYWKLLTDLSEIQKYLPDGHVDKVVEEKWIPKVGDWVYIEEAENGARGANESIGVITKPTNSASGLPFGMYVDVKKNSKEILYNKIWCIGVNPKIRKAEAHEIFDRNESLLEEAKKKYPVGTKFRSVENDSLTYTIKGSDFKRWINVKYPESFNSIIEEDSGGIIYSQGKWAEIISTLESENITNRLSNIRINNNFNESIKTNNVLLLDTVIQPIKIKTISDKLNTIKQIKILTLK